MDAPTSTQSADILAKATQILTARGIFENPYFDSLESGQMSFESFLGSQRQFYFAVDYFSRPMSVLLSRITCPKRRLSILENIVEEHGGFESDRFHEATFRSFLSELGSAPHPVRSEIGPQVHAFNAAIMGTCSSDDVPVGIACLGIIEYAFAHISAMIGASVVNRGWVASGRLVHYSLHTELDKKHAADFFALLENDWEKPSTRVLVQQGLELGAYLFDRLYRDLAVTSETS